MTNKIRNLLILFEKKNTTNYLGTSLIVEELNTKIGQRIVSLYSIYFNKKKTYFYKKHIP